MSPTHRFYDLMCRKGAPVFAAFDVLELDGEDLRDLPLLDRKKALRRAVRSKASAVQVVDYVRGPGIELYATTRALDLEGIVAKRADSLYRVTMPPERGILVDGEGLEPPTLWV